MKIARFQRGMVNTCYRIRTDWCGSGAGFVSGVLLHRAPRSPLAWCPACAALDTGGSGSYSQQTTQRVIYCHVVWKCSGQCRVDDHNVRCLRVPRRVFAAHQGSKVSPRIFRAHFIVFERPNVIHRISPTECSRSRPLAESVSPNTVLASSNVTPCLRSLASALAESHANLMIDHRPNVRAQAARSRANWQNYDGESLNACGLLSGIRLVVG